jgi:CheY-like chemotaxis protein
MSIDNNPLVLIADDLPQVIAYYKRQLLDRYDISTVSATTLEQLDEVFDKFFHEIDVIILDGCIPGDTVNTISFIKRAREMGFTRPIIAASSMPAYRMQMIAAGCSHEIDDKEFAPELASWLVKSA